MRFVSAVVVALALCACVAKTSPGSFLITNVAIIDGSGSETLHGSVRIDGAFISAVGQLRPLRGERVADGFGLVLAPGFIDTHSHHDQGLADQPDALAATSQGITTIVRGQDGFSNEVVTEFTTVAEYNERFEQNPAAINMASCAPHNTIRQYVLGADFKRHASSDEVAAMADLLRADFRAGALALSTGLEYDPGIYASTDELVVLASVAAQQGAGLVSHIRSEDRDFWASIEEVIDIGRRAGVSVHISHLKLAARSIWGDAGRLLTRLDEARAAGVDVSADVYPYAHWMSTATVMYPKRQFDDVDESRLILDTLVSADELTFVRYDADPALVGRSLTDISNGNGRDPAELLSEMVSRGARLSSATNTISELVIARGMAAADVEDILRWSHTNIGSDGSLASEHPRGSGSFTRVLGRYVRDRKLVGLEEAVHKMTGLAATNIGIAGRGRIARGMAADLVLFDPQTVADRATFEKPTELSVGIVKVWVNGDLVFANGEATGATPGEIVRRQ